MGLATTMTAAEINRTVREVELLDQSKINSTKKREVVERLRDYKESLLKGDLSYQDAKKLCEYLRNKYNLNH